MIRLIALVPSVAVLAAILPMLGRTIEALNASTRYLA